MDKAIISGVISFGVLLLVPGSGASSIGRADDQYRVVSERRFRSNFEQELNRTAADGYQLVVGDAAREVAMFVRSSDTIRRSYRFASSVGGLLKDTGLPTGFRLIPQTFSGDVVYSAIFEKVEGDVQPREYRLTEAGSAGALAKKLEKGEVETGFGVLAVAAGQYGAGAISERQPDARRAILIASGRPDAVREALSGAVAKGHCLIHGAATKDVLYLLRDCGAAKDRTYELLARLRRRRPCSPESM